MIDDGSIQTARRPNYIHLWSEVVCSGDVVGGSSKCSMWCLSSIERRGNRKRTPSVVELLSWGEQLMGGNARQSLRILGIGLFEQLSGVDGDLRESLAQQLLAQNVLLGEGLAGATELVALRLP